MSQILRTEQTAPIEIWAQKGKKNEEPKENKAPIAKQVMKKSPELNSKISQLHMIIAQKIHKLLTI